MTDLKTLYQTDYAAWARRHVELLRAGRFAELDIEHLLDQLGDMSKSDRRELESRLMTLMAYLLKWEYQYQALSEQWREFDGRSWRGTIIEQRKQLAGNCSDPCKQNSTLADKSELTWQDMAPSPSSRVSESDASAFPPCSSANTILPSSTRRPWRR